ncbi:MULTISPECIES: DMT family transporter [Cryobacterium]|uniref:Multidrug DMT transporter permease n=1 Tax=Cryobacterium zongtaii TaxID=1259217 RepID=A0A2S3ZIX1_9MICO|nr:MULTISPECIES: DMT family transporter [Cryobacterium]ASD22063.1 multidrug DMT transporter permease [Cryobacterium sp. LW097]MEC5182595.1 drug/metabolite transporter (DMT)-like permease [Cryobacterium sp. MP_3.1]POH62864.1 multidrug DMT transporter permease [Cryobacterium zongtaii]POH67275.1 multidrug DMT transporter permease [Cryobacterium zongtaii]TFC48985.1 multidrug DMT transporter permease [Cryobacterium sp. TMN-39-2]
MTPDLTDLAGEIAIDPRQAIGIPLALIGAVFLSLGAQFQHRGVTKVEAHTREITGGLNTRQLVLLLSRPSWVFGTVMLGLAIAFQLTSLAFAPLIVVQPLGAVALVITAILNARVSHVKLNRASVIAIAMCVGGVGLFVTVAAFTAVDKPVTDANLITILVVLAVVLAAFAVAFVLLRSRFKAIFYIIGAGVLYGFVATLAKVIINRIQNGNVEWLTVVCVVGLLLAAASGAYFVQNAYSSGPPDLVIAGLTVIDPMIAVGIGVIVLGEASQAPTWAAVLFAVAGAVAMWGVFRLAKYHPQTQS